MSDITTVENSKKSSLEITENKTWKEVFVRKLKNSMTKCLDYPGHGSSMLDLNDVFYKPDKANYLNDGLLNILYN